MRPLTTALHGLFPVIKPKGITSAGVVNKLKKVLFQERNQKLSSCEEFDQETHAKVLPRKLRIGHGGTLDKNASGVLVIGIGRGTKLLSSMLKGNKRYRTVGCLGTATDTHDAVGRVTQVLPFDHVSQEMMVSALQQFVGNTMQVPPLYSALKVDGVRMSDLAKRDANIAPKPARPVSVHSLTCANFCPPYFTLDIECGGGFYVRKLIHDLGQDLGTCAHVVELIRTQQGPFTLACHALAEDKWTLQHICDAVEAFNKIARGTVLLMTLAD